jgi:signal peptide peptidase SppA
MRNALPADFLGPWAVEPSRFHLPSFGLAPPWAAAPAPAAKTVDVYAGLSGKAVAVIRASGLLMKPTSWFGTSTVQLRRDIQAAADDPGTSAILLSIDSPGGTVAGLADLAADVRAARKRKPVWAHIDDLGASAAYWLASQADAVYANSPDALVGSIGTILVVHDLSAMAEREGVRPVVFATGPLKGAGTPGTPVTPDQQAYFQAIVDGVQQSFDAAVMAGRTLTREQLDAAKTGGVFLAKEAKTLGLIDGIRPFKATLAALAAQR